MIFAQDKRGAIWYFGYGGVGIDFSDVNNPTPLDNGANMATREGCTSVCDSNGALLFYSNGEFIWDSSQTPMPNGSNLSGNESATQSVLAAPVIGEDHRYYLFTVDAHENSGAKGLRYSIVDMDLEGNGTLSEPKGDIDPAHKDIMLTTGAVSEKLTIAKHKNERDYWVIVKTNSLNEYHAFLVSEEGIATTPITTSFAVSGNPRGALVASADGEMLVEADINSVNIYDFDNCTGKIKDGYLTLSTSYTYGVCFSPNDSIIYFADGIVAGKGRLFTFDRYSNDILGSVDTIAFSTIRPRAMKLGIDQKIYFTDFSSTKLIHTIQNPNDRFNPQIKDSTFVFSFPGVRYGLPNNYFPSLINIVEDKKLAINDTTICSEAPISIGLANKDSSLQYIWTNNISMDTLEGSSPLAYISQSITFHVSTVGVCSQILDKDTTTITISEELCNTQLFIPNAVSLNSDGINDYLNIIKEGDIVIDQFILYDRYGKKVFDNNHLNELRNGVLFENSALVYILTYTEKGISKIKTGSILALNNE